MCERAPFWDEVSLDVLLHVGLEFNLGWLGLSGQVVGEQLKLLHHAVAYHLIVTVEPHGDGLAVQHFLPYKSVYQTAQLGLGRRSLPAGLPVAPQPFDFEAGNGDQLIRARISARP